MTSELSLDKRNLAKEKLILNEYTRCKILFADNIQKDANMQQATDIKVGYSTYLSHLAPWYLPIPASFCVLGSPLLYLDYLYSPPASLS